MKISSLLPLLVVALLTTGCDDIFGADRDTIEFTVASSRYEPGDRVTMHLANHTGETIGYNLCMLELERRVQDGWVSVAYRENTVCPAIEYRLASGASDSVHIMLPESFPADEYRGRTDVRLGEASIDVVTESFLVQESTI